jgi:signal transduction histidine kinase
MNRPARHLVALPKSTVVVLAFALICLIGFFDYITGRDFHVSAFYLVPIIWGAWVNGRKAGIMLAISGAVAWFIADLMSGFIYDHPLIRYWDSLMLLVFFLTVVHFLARFRSAHNLLESTLQQRTAAVKALEAEITQRKRMEVAKLQAERLAVVGKMAAQVAHEVRNPLGSITLNLDLIHKEINRMVADGGHSPGEARTLLQDIREEICRIGRVVEDYLQFARLPKLQRRPLALNAFLDQKLAFLCTELERANVKLHTNFDPVLTTINVDADQLWPAMLNLIRNSCEAMPGGGELTIDTRFDGGQVVLRVIDIGKGMTEEQRQQVFTPFFTTKKEGIGLGMALVHQIVTEHGGHVECESIRGKGSTFTIILPRAESP